MITEMYTDLVRQIDRLSRRDKGGGRGGGMLALPWSQLPPPPHESPRHQPKRKGQKDRGKKCPNLADPITKDTRLSDPEVDDRLSKETRSCTFPKITTFLYLLKRCWFQGKTFVVVVVVALTRFRLNAA